MSSKGIIQGVSMDSHCVYWYHLETQIDPFSMGYIGVTKNMEHRHKQHFHEKGNRCQHFHIAIQKYGKENILLTILFQSLNKKEAYRIERQYRPTKNIGWNYNTGGQCLFDKEFHKVTLFHMDNPSKEFTFNSITEASEALGIGRLRINDALKRKTNGYGRDGWHVIHENTDKKTILTNSQSLSKAIKGRKLIYKSHPRWRRVKLIHINEPNKEYIFDSISKAARQVGTSLSALTHKLYRDDTKPTKEGWSIQYLGSQDSSNE